MAAAEDEEADADISLQDNRITIKYKECTRYQVTILDHKDKT
jgi:hypothetical protein